MAAHGPEALKHNPPKDAREKTTELPAKLNGM
jgi:hypothetical protein